MSARSGALILAAAVAAACSSGTLPSEETSGSAAMAPPPIDWARCDATVRRLRYLPIADRARELTDACPVCTDFKPLLDWRRPHESGGPTRAALELAMFACDGYCDPTAKQRFLGTLDDARGTAARTPWRLLGEECKGEVGAAHDARFASATLLALDRIGRAVAAHGGLSATLLPGAEIPLPAVSISGVGVVLPTARADGAVPRMQLTVTATEIRVGALPVAHLRATGLEVDAGDAAYPGTLTDDPAAALGSADEVVVIAPAQMAAARVADVVAKLRTAKIVLASAHRGDAEWTLVGAIPVSLRDPAAAPDAHAQVVALGSPAPAVQRDGGPVVVITGATATVSDLADALEALRGDGIKQITLRAAQGGSP